MKKRNPFDLSYVSKKTGKRRGVSISRDTERKKGVSISHTSRKTGKRRGISVSGISNPAPVLIYGRVLRIEAQKTQPHICDAGCRKSGHRYFHDFGPGVKMFGLPNKDLLLTKR